MHPSDPEMRSPVTRQSDRANSQSSKFSHPVNSPSSTELQVAKLRRLFQFNRETADTIASLAFSGEPR
jgi:hypothetical protein